MEKLAGTAFVERNRIDCPVVVTGPVEKVAVCDETNLHSKSRLAQQRILSDILNDEEAPNPPYRLPKRSNRLCGRTGFYSFIILVILSVVAIPLVLMVKKNNDESYAERINSSNNVLVDSPQPSPLPSSLPSSSPVDLPTFVPSVSQSPSDFPTMLPSSLPSSSSVPSEIPTLSRTPSKSPTAAPSESPTSKPSISHQPSRSSAPTIPFVFGDSFVTNNDLGLELSAGLSARLIAVSGRSVKYSNGQESGRRFHFYMDAAGVVSLPDGGYVYMSNSEDDGPKGGVFGLYFDRNGDLVQYKALLTGTTWNCGGGLTPWNTWISCEEHSAGQCWQVDPDPSSERHSSPQITRLGGRNGGQYESVACDNRNPDRPVFFVTEDHEAGALRRFEADGNGWDSLHSGGTTTYLQFLDGSRFQWTTSESAGRSSANRYYRNAEGISYFDGVLYFTVKTTKSLFILDLDKMTYTRESTGTSLEGKGSFASEPDQIVLTENKKYIYFAEEGGWSPGVYVRDRQGSYFTIFQGIPQGRFQDDETVGIALSPDRRRLYSGMQESGMLFEITRDDGMPFE